MAGEDHMFSFFFIYKFLLGKLKKSSTFPVAFKEDDSRKVETLNPMRLSSENNRTTSGDLGLIKVNKEPLESINI